MEQFLHAPWYIQALAAFIAVLVITVVAVGTKVTVSNFKQS